MNFKALSMILGLIFLEWLDFSLYLYLAKSIFASRFFPESAQSLTLSFALFAAAYLARPLGGWLFGRRADSSGRRTPLIVSAVLMGIATLGIALLPEYSVIGISATWGLLIFRVGQGLALGGEINNSAMFLIEHHSRTPLIAGSLLAASGAAGMFVGGATAALLQTVQIDWLWRVIFLMVGLISLGVCRLRKTLTESPEFIANTTDFRQIVREYGQQLTRIAVAAIYVSVLVYLCNAYWVSYATDQGFWSPSTCSWAGSLAQLASALIALPIARKTPSSQVVSLLRSSMLMAFISTPLLFLFTTQAFIPGILLGLSCYVLTNGLLCSSLFYFLYLQLPAQYRCRGVSTIWALAATVGAFSLPIAQQAHLNHMPWFAPIWVAMVAIFGYWILGSPRAAMVKVV